MTAKLKGTAKRFGLASTRMRSPNPSHGCSNSKLRGLLIHRRTVSILPLSSRAASFSKRRHCRTLSGPSSRASVSGSGHGVASTFFSSAAPIDRSMGSSTGAVVRVRRQGFAKLALKAKLRRRSWFKHLAQSHPSRETHLALRLGQATSA